jgi:membrane fusion protein, multidrug efflux system
MQSWMKLSLIATFTILAIACGGDTRQKQLKEKKSKLESLKKEEAELAAKIDKLEDEIAKLDTARKPDNAKLVVVDTLRPANFTHFIDLQGTVVSENISYVTPRGMGGQVRAIYVKEGDYVNKGKLLLKLDDAVIRQNVVAARQGMEATKTQLTLAKSLYQRQKNLWEQNIGTEVQVLQAKTAMEALEQNLKTQLENVKAAEEQLKTTMVYSEVSGVAEEVNIHVGETFTGSPMNGIKIVNTGSLKVETEIPENYLSKVNKGTPVVVTVPDLNLTFNSTISLLSQTVGTVSRGFKAEIKLPANKSLKPNMIVMVRIQDYKAGDALTVPVNVLQTDETGKFVMVSVREGEKLVARKRDVVIGELYRDQLEVKSGLQPGDVIVTEGFQNLYDGQVIILASQK